VVTNSLAIWLKLLPFSLLLGRGRTHTARLFSPMQLAHVTPLVYACHQCCQPSFHHGLPRFAASTAAPARVQYPSLQDDVLWRLLGGPLGPSFGPILSTVAPPTAFRTSAAASPCPRAAAPCEDFWQDLSPHRSEVSTSPAGGCVVGAPAPAPVEPWLAPIGALAEEFDVQLKTMWQEFLNRILPLQSFADDAQSTLLPKVETACARTVALSSRLDDSADELLAMRPLITSLQMQAGAHDDQFARVEDASEVLRKRTNGLEGRLAKRETEANLLHTTLPNYAKSSVIEKLNKKVHDIAAECALLGASSTGLFKRNGDSDARLSALSADCEAVRVTLASVDERVDAATARCRALGEQVSNNVQQCREVHTEEMAAFHDTIEFHTNDLARLWIRYGDIRQRLTALVPSQPSAFEEFLVQDAPTIPDPVDDLTFPQVAAGLLHTVLLRSDGKAVACGDSDSRQCSISDLEEDLTHLQVAAGGEHSVLLGSDGKAVACGYNVSGQCTIPDLEEDLTFAQAAAGRLNTVRPGSDGKAVTGGDSGSRQCSIPDLEEGLTHPQIAAGAEHTLRLSSDSKAVACGIAAVGQCSIPDFEEDLTHAQAAAGQIDTVLLTGDGKAVTRRVEALAPQAPTSCRDRSAKGTFSLCTVHRKRRSASYLVSDGTGGLVCAPGHACVTVTSDWDSRWNWTPTPTSSPQWNWTQTPMTTSTASASTEATPAVGRRRSGG
jgi:hypothetical protein